MAKIEGTAAISPCKGKTFANRSQRCCNEAFVGSTATLVGRLLIHAENTGSGVASFVLQWLNHFAIGAAKEGYADGMPLMAIGYGVFMILASYTLAGLNALEA